MMIKCILPLFTLLATTIFTFACTSNTEHLKAARYIAGPAFMNDRQINTSPFDVTLFERIHNRGGAAHIYIEGDDLDITSGYITKNESLYQRIQTQYNPPISLHLASRDRAKNVIYMGRPCQFDSAHSNYSNQTQSTKSCDKAFAKDERLSEEVINAYNTALEDLKQRWDITGFHIYGHSGGAALGAFIAAERDDVISLTTINGILDNDTYAHKKTLTASKSASSIASKLSALPQMHYIGGADTTNSTAMLHNFLSAMGSTECGTYDFIQENGYTKGWVEKWPLLLKNTPICRN